MYICIYAYKYTSIPTMCVCVRTGVSHTHTHKYLHRDLQKNVTFLCSKGSQKVQTPGFVVPIHGKS